MSDTEDEGSFDREAEKEKLREQLAREEEARRSTQHMSELLLKGATMTNKHCDTCGDPLFRYEGQEFCPTCSQGAEQQVAEGESTEDADVDAAGDDGGSAPARGIGVSEPGAGGVDRIDGAGTSETEGTDRTGADSGISAAPPEGSAARSDATPTAPVTGSAGSQSSPTPGGDAADDVAGARAALARKLATLARQAEATDDVGRSRELLSAAREAAEALAAVDAIGR